MSRGPLPSELCLLSSLPTREVGDKVRFLGCVTRYSISEGELSLNHQYPAGTRVTVKVDVELLLQSLNAEATRSGEWVNIIGYVTENMCSEQHGGPTVKVQALALWQAGPLDIERYERGFDNAVVEGRG